jgi:uncharacterized peroxidase-related enzyme
MNIGQQAVSQSGLDAQLTSVTWLRLEPAAAPSDALADLAEASMVRYGFVRNLFVAGTLRPAQTRAAQMLANAVLGESGNLLSLREREVMALVVSSENRCVTCVVAHSASLRGLGMASATVDLIATNYRHSGLAGRERVLADFAFRVTRSPSECSESDLLPLRDIGLSEGEIMEAAYTIAYFNFSNRLLSSLGIPPNAGYHTAFR